MATDALDFVVSDPDRRGECFVEWRVTDPRVSAALGALQRRLASLPGGGPDAFQMLQSCAADNLHVTMNELVLRSADEVRRCLACLSAFAATHLAAVLAESARPDYGPPVAFTGVTHFGRRVVFVGIGGVGGAALVALHGAIDVALRAAGFAPKPCKGGVFAPHVTLGKGVRGEALSPAFFAAVSEAGLDTATFGVAPLANLVFCVKRRKTEATPPVLLRLASPPPSAEDGAACAGGREEK